MRYLDLFAGYGGFSLGIQQAYENSRMGRDGQTDNSLSGGQEAVNGSGVGDKQAERPSDEPHESTPTCIGFSEIDKYAIQVYSKHFPEHKNYGDITKINPDELPDFDLICGGFPCQSFSIAGKRGGFNDTRGTLFFDIARIIKVKKPRLLLLENVKGLLSHDNGKTFATIISTLDELGYDLQWQVLNSKNHGVPQNRERVFIIGHLGGFGGRQVFPIGEGNNNANVPDGKNSSVCTPPITTQGGKNCRGMFIEQLNNPTHSNNRLYGEDGISPALNTAQGGNRQPKICKAVLSTKHKSGDNQTVVAIPVLTPDRPEKRQNGRRFKEDGDPSFTLTAQDKHGIYDGMKIRRLTPTECERLMGLKDNWTAEGTEGKISDTQRYKLCGNGVVVNVVEEIIKRLK